MAFASPTTRAAAAFAAIALSSMGCAGDIGSAPQDSTTLALPRDAGQAPRFGDTAPPPDVAPDGLAADARDGDRPADDGAPPRDAVPRDAPAADGGCGALAGVARFTCAADGNSRARCAAGAPLVEHCPRGCLRRAPPAADECMGSGSPWSCSGIQGTAKAADGDYFLSSFGCWIDDHGIPHADPGDNCVPLCLQQAQAAGLCAPGDSGPTCERKIQWYTANSGRFGCLQRLRISDPQTGQAVVAVVLDGGPACWVEHKVSKAILDASYPVAKLLFGSARGWSDHALVHVVEVDVTTPLGPVP